MTTATFQEAWMCHSTFHVIYANCVSGHRSWGLDSRGSGFFRRRYKAFPTVSIELIATTRDRSAARSGYLHYTDDRSIGTCFTIFNICSEEGNVLLDVANNCEERFSFKYRAGYARINIVQQTFTSASEYYTLPLTIFQSFHVLLCRD